MHRLGAIDFVTFWTLVRMSGEPASALLENRVVPVSVRNKGGSMRLLSCCIAL